MRRALLIAVAVVLILGAVAWMRLARSEVDIGETATVTRGALERIVVASGTIEPEDLVEVRPKVSGIVEHFRVDDGDRVRAGQVVAEIDRETLQAAVREARAIVQETLVERDHAGLELRRRIDLFKRGVESQDALDRDRAAHAAAEARLQHAQATLERLEQELAYATITAPIDGVVLRRELNPGAAVPPVTDATDAYPGRHFPGRVRKIASLGDRKENVTSFKVEVTVLDGVHEMWPRMSGDADIVAEVRDGALIVPEAALLYDGDTVLVEVVERASGPHLVRRPVRTGIFNADRVEIVDGLAEGDEVKLQ